MSNFIVKMRQQPAWIALFIFVALCLWVASGHLTAQQAEDKSKHSAIQLTKVKVETFNAEMVSREINLYGRTEPDRITSLRSEVQGQVTAVFVNEGQQVKQGQKILSLDANDLSAKIRSAKAILKQRQIELTAAKALSEKGFQSQSQLALAEANVEYALAEIQGLELGLSKTSIFAPFDGVLNKRHVEIGDLLREGDAVATIVDLDPLIIKADVTENWIQSIKTGQVAKGRLTTGENVEGVIRYISSVSNVGTNTFTLEVAVPNPKAVLLAGMSTELSIPLAQEWAIKITPAVMGLDEDGSLGVKTVEQGTVRFIPIDIVKSDSEGVWLSGLGQQAEVITRGQGFVRHGDKVEAIAESPDNESAKR
ncbi:efflux RND transporter periplasmic adaptor subunit [Aliiglaciecola sp. LCG003]|uniref:efflux RND transporter periplasmic adaptor subunit n=1 Tax=Aliiglaciecola sp. LCG003 TaxID=3053655 RepID=UPI002574303F|nr:efflux RND transporter periplasmic adaptor subunit [Aliiglaciecola sp. LCG003]WJG08917.1 efflux RND transporter periplasmic adaptor subunit [Aliiglaciecola sp. LCG003]